MPYAMTSVSLQLKVVGPTDEYSTCSWRAAYTCDLPSAVNSSVSILASAPGVGSIHLEVLSMVVPYDCVFCQHAAEQPHHYCQQSE